MSRKEETGDVGQAEIAGNFNTRFIFRKEEKVQIAAMSRTGERTELKSRSGIFPNGFLLMNFYKVFYYFFNIFLRPKPATPIRTIPNNSMEACFEIVSPKFSAKAYPVNTKLIKNIAKNETIKTIKTFFMTLPLLQISNLKI
jgi:hypothetical protein